MKQCEARTNDEMITYDPKAVEGDCPNEVYANITNYETGAVVPICREHDAEIVEISAAIRQMAMRSRR